MTDATQQAAVDTESLFEAMAAMMKKYRVVTPSKIRAAAPGHTSTTFGPTNRTVLALRPGWIVRTCLREAPAAGLIFGRRALNGERNATPS